MDLVLVYTSKMFEHTGWGQIVINRKFTVDLY
eukprot:SAG11_NODE_28578_length_320_cov_0.696833_1_plen_31_part_10